MLPHWKKPDAALTSFYHEPGILLPLTTQYGVTNPSFPVPLPRYDIVQAAAETASTQHFGVTYLLVQPCSPYRLHTPPPPRRKSK